MYKYDSFEEYLQLNYFEEFKTRLAEYIEENELDVFSDDVHHKHYDDYDIYEIKVAYVQYTKSQVDKVEFDVYLDAKFVVTDKVYDEKSPWPPVLTRKGRYIYRMKGSFKKGFKGQKQNEMSKIELEEEPERISSGLVPVIKYEELDNYATKFLKFFCPEALETPMKLKLNDILNKNGITYYLAPLEDDVYGKTYFANDKATIYKFDEDDFFSATETEEIDVGPGTILVNFFKHMDRPKGVYRNTIIHECVHWFFHRNYFELRHCLNEEDTSVTCYKSNRTFENIDVEWMEWQARSLAPRILMPKKMAIMKYDELAEEVEELEGADEMTFIEKTNWILKRFAAFFEVSLQSAQIRLKELGKSRFDGVRNYVDGGYIKDFTFKDRFLKKNQTFIISSDELGKLLYTNSFVRESLTSGKLLYINKMLVINNPKYVDCKKYVLTDYALEHVHECALVFNVERFGIDDNGELIRLNFLSSTVNGRKEIKSLDENQLEAMLSSAKIDGSHYEKHKSELPTTFHETLEYHIKCAKRKKIIKGYEDLAFESDVSDKTIRSYKDGLTSPSRINVIKIGLALKLSAPYIIDLLTKADQLMVYTGAENILLYTIIYSYQRVGLEEVCIALMKNHNASVLDFSDTYLKNHGITEKKGISFSDLFQ